ncbi:hypothetical protein PS627_02133 [Pseudomonas fluorescens]|uniref:hypothetical protein n=1 Tax=Pseudomonas fluorescens TaxID=294 RepID=UPI0012568004|nr:hypothetical protein [Pseudomonas fluorescens]CAG8866845.1 hypothetical protein PS627_02133 [Pseudomonas fluorescens]VVP90940.1 hypothetical protein PS910_02872 [Pseudomonas fluorescens]
MSRVEPTSPLTIIAIFAGIIEASALASLPFLSEGSQTIYTWFLVCFPFFLTVLFFLTLNFNYKSLYIPMAKAEPSSAPAPVAEDVPPDPGRAHALPSLAAPREGAAPPAEAKDVITIALSGNDARAVIEKQLSRSMDQQPAKAFSWVIYNLDTQTCITVDVRPMEAHEPVA